MAVESYTEALLVARMAIDSTEFAKGMVQMFERHSLDSGTS